MRLKGLKCVVSGGASGIGAATHAICGRGCGGLHSDRDCQRPRRCCGVRSRSFAVELDGLELAVEQAAGVYPLGHIDVLVNNAGSELNKTITKQRSRSGTGCWTPTSRAHGFSASILYPLCERGSGSVIISS